MLRGFKVGKSKGFERCAHYVGVLAVDTEAVILQLSWQFSSPSYQKVSPPILLRKRSPRTNCKILQHRKSNKLPQSPLTPSANNQ